MVDAFVAFGFDEPLSLAVSDFAPFDFAPLSLLLEDDESLDEELSLLDFVSSPPEAGTVDRFEPLRLSFL